MFDCFISYTQADERFATNLAQFLESQRLRTFIATLSLAPGSSWSEKIKQALNSSKWVLFLASRTACSSAAVQQEVGGAIFGGKRLIPIVWDMDPSLLPAWAREYQAIDLRGMTSKLVLATMESLAQELGVRLKSCTT